MSKRKKKNKNTKKFVFDINKYCGNFMCSLEEYGKKSCFYWFDTASYQVVGVYRWLTDKQKSMIDNDEHGRFVLFPQYIADSRYKNLVKELNNPKVTKFFEDVKSEEEAHFRYRCFIDWNGLEHDEWYRDKIIMSKILIRWCEDNGIKYTYKRESPPEDYAYDGRDLSNIDWYVEDIEYVD